MKAEVFGVPPPCTEQQAIAGGRATFSGPMARPPAVVVEPRREAVEGWSFFYCMAPTWSPPDRRTSGKAMTTEPTGPEPALSIREQIDAVYSAFLRGTASTRSYPDVSGLQHQQPFEPLSREDMIEQAIRHAESVGGSPALAFAFLRGMLLDEIRLGPKP